MNGPLEALETPDGKSQHRVPGSRSLVPKGVVQEGDWVHGPAEVDCKQSSTLFHAKNWDQLEGMAETLVASGTSGLDSCGRWGQVMITQ